MYPCMLFHNLGDVPLSNLIRLPDYAKWIKSHRDLPLRLNQWNSVVRWEFKNPREWKRAHIPI